MERKLQHHLCASDIELLAQLAEEASEVAQAAMKIIRHGWDSYNPDLADGSDNRLDLAKEIDDFDAVVLMLRTGGRLVEKKAASGVPGAILRKRKYQHYQG